MVCDEGSVIVWYDNMVSLWLVEWLCLVGCIYSVIDVEFELYF